MSQQAEILVAGRGGKGEALILTQPISFWGGVDPKTGRIADVRHPQHGQCIADRVLFLPGTIGRHRPLRSFSNSSTTATRLPRSCHEPDAILLL